MKQVKRKGNENRLSKGESQEIVHKGGPSVSKKGKEPHRRDGNAPEGNTKKQDNNI